MYYIVNMNGERRVNNGFDHEDSALAALGGGHIAECFLREENCIIEWQDEDEDYIGDHADTVVLANGLEVEEFNTEIIYDESGIEVGETSTRLPILKIDNHNCWHEACQCSHCRSKS